MSACVLFIPLQKHTVCGFCACIHDGTVIRDALRVFVSDWINEIMKTHHRTSPSNHNVNISMFLFVYRTMCQHAMTVDCQS